MKLEAIKPEPRTIKSPHELINLKFVDPNYDHDDYSTVLGMYERWCQDDGYELWDYPSDYIIVAKSGDGIIYGYISFKLCEVTFVKHFYVRPEYRHTHAVRMLYRWMLSTAKKRKNDLVIGAAPILQDFWSKKGWKPWRVMLKRSF